jgi:hypothetical protein
MKQSKRKQRVISRQSRGSVEVPPAQAAAGEVLR